MLKVWKEMDRLWREEMKRAAALPPVNVTLQDKEDAALTSAPSAGAKDGAHKTQFDEFAQYGHHLGWGW